MVYVSLFVSLFLYLIHQFSCFFFFFNDTATTEIYTLSLHDALPISTWCETTPCSPSLIARSRHRRIGELLDRKSTRLNSSHGYISYAVFCLKKKKNKNRLFLFVRKVKHTSHHFRLSVLTITARLMWH